MDKKTQLPKTWQDATETELKALAMQPAIDAAVESGNSNKLYELEETLALD